MRRGAIRDRLDERGAFAGASALDRATGRLVDGEDVATVYAHPRYSVPDRLVGEGRGGRLLRERRRDRPLVVVAEEDRRRLHDPREGRALVHGPLGGRSVAEVRDRDAVLALESRPPGEPHCVRHVRPDRHADRGDVVLLRIPPAGRMSAPPAEDRRGPECRAGARSQTRDSSGRSSRDPRARTRSRPASPRGSRRSRTCRSAPAGGRPPSARRTCGGGRGCGRGRQARPTPRPSTSPSGMPSPSPMTRRRSPSAGSTRLIEAPSLGSRRTRHARQSCSEAPRRGP